MNNAALSEAAAAQGPGGAGQGVGRGSSHGSEALSPVDSLTVPKAPLPLPTTPPWGWACPQVTPLPSQHPVCVWEVGIMNPTF